MMRFVSRRAIWTLAAICAAGLVTSAQAQQNQTPRRSTAQLKEAFRNMERKTKANLRAPGVKTRSLPVGTRGGKATVISGSRFAGVGLEFRIELVPDDSREGSGKYANLLTYAFHPKERFYVWLKTATPAQVALIQGFEDGRPDVVVMPDEQFPESFNTLTPDAGKDGYVRFPILMQMDDDLEPEIMKIAVFTPDVIQKGSKLTAADLLGGAAAGGATDADGSEDASTVDPSAADDDEPLTGPSGNELRSIKQTAERIASLHDADPEFRRRTRFQLGVAVRGDDQGADSDLVEGTVIAVNESSRVGVTELKLNKKPR